MEIDHGSLPFTVDSALLEELGERLVGKPYVALSELVKNSYDADATEVTITLDEGGSRILVNDNGHGMSFEDFKRYWMRIGSTHKAKRESKYFGRRMTGSKGVGRLAVQFLGRELEVYTRSEEEPYQRLVARVDWSKAIAAKELTQVEIGYRIEKSNEPYPKGTLLIIYKLKSSWSEKDIRSLAREIWWLKPPFRGLLDTSDSKHKFDVDLVSHRDFVEAFNEQMAAILDIWYARIIGKAVEGKATISIQWAGNKPRSHSYVRENWHLKEVDFEIRIYYLTKQQPRGIRVEQAREYMNEFGGINIYDGGFRLPYYGDPRNDWLGIELDHSHRRTTSRFLPMDLQEGVSRGLQFLPTLGRLLGVVNVRTSIEDDLDILVTRDRLTETAAFGDLVWIVRYALDLYSLWEQRRNIREKEAEVATLEESAIRLEDVFDKYRDEISKSAVSQFKKDIEDVIVTNKAQAELIAARVGLMGSLATAGITTLAYQHENKTLMRKIKRTIDRIDEIKATVKLATLKDDLAGLKQDLTQIYNQSQRNSRLFSHLADPENIEIRERFPAHRVIDNIRRQIGFLLGGVKVETERIDLDLLLPKASIAEWTAIFQNVLLNSYNAMLAAKRRIIDISSRKRGPDRQILIQDTGVGVNLKSSEELFEPFVRETKIPEELQAAGYGGSGLGLTIVRMIAHNIGCVVSFVEPEGKYKTAFSLRWRETK